MYYFLHRSVECSMNWWRFEGCTYVCMMALVKWQTLAGEYSGCTVQNHVFSECTYVWVCVHMHGTQVEVKTNSGVSPQESWALTCFVWYKVSTSLVWEFATLARFFWPKHFQGPTSLCLPPNPASPRILGVYNCASFLHGFWGIDPRFSCLLSYLPSPLHY